MRKPNLLSAIVCICALTVSAMGYPVTGDYYDADEVVNLPDPPSGSFTNYASGSINAMDYVEGQPLDYTIVIENEWDPLRWKEILLKLQLTNLDSRDFLMEVHVDFSRSSTTQGTPPYYLEAYWNVLYARFKLGPGEQDPLTIIPPQFLVVGFPGNNLTAPVALDPADVAAANVILDYSLPAQHPLEVPFYDWNPEWVSLSFHGWGFEMDYELTDWCVPEPATMSLLGFGGVMLLLRRRKQR